MKILKSTPLFRGVNTALHLDFSKDKVPTRNGYGDGLVELGTKNKNVVALCADLTESIRVEPFATKFPRRFFEMGVAEQNLVTVASGLAAVGKIPFASSYAAFCPGRCWEQIRTTICYNNQPVKIVGAHAGISVGPDGATHQALEDVALMRSLPNMIVVVPADYEQAKKATLAIADYKGPAYLRLTRSKTAQMTSARTPFRLGEAQVFKQGNDVAIIGAGPILQSCLEAAALLEREGIHARVINCHTIKPLDEKIILRAAKECKRVVTVEEHQITGGLGGAVAEFLGEHFPVPLRRIGVQDRFGESGEPDELMKVFKLDATAIVKACLDVVKIKK